jgi:hypothetical protein
MRVLSSSDLVAQMWPYPEPHLNCYSFTWGQQEMIVSFTSQLRKFMCLVSSQILKPSPKAHLTSQVPTHIVQPNQRIAFTLHKPFSRQQKLYISPQDSSHAPETCAWFRGNSAMWTPYRKQQQHNILIGQNAQVAFEWKLGGVDMLAACEAYKKLPGNIWNHTKASTCLTVKAYPTHNPQRKQPQIHSHHWSPLSTLLCLNPDTNPLSQRNSMLSEELVEETTLVEKCRLSVPSRSDLVSSRPHNFCAIWVARYFPKP